MGVKLAPYTLTYTKLYVYGCSAGVWSLFGVCGMYSVFSLCGVCGMYNVFSLCRVSDVHTLCTVCRVCRVSSSSPANSS